MNEGTYSKDLRKRAIEYVLQGGSKREACKTFKIGHNTLYRWLRHYKETKRFTPQKRSNYGRKYKDQALTQYIGKHQDATLMEIGEKLKISYVTVWRALERLNFTRKKKLHLQRT
jgi:transposase